MNDAYTYMMSNKSHTLYVGSTVDIVLRVRQHKNREAGFTSRYHFTRLIWVEVFTDISAARRRERQIKGWTRAKKVALIQEGNPKWMDLSANWSEYLMAR